MSVIVFGASHGYGRSIVNESLKQGKLVVACSRNALSETGFEKQKVEFPTQLIVLNTNVTDIKELKNCFQTINTAREYIDEIYFTVGVPQDTTSTYPLEAMTEEQFLSIIRINAYSAFETLRQATKCLNEPFSGAYIYFSSTAAMSSKSGYGTYNVSKLLLNGLMTNYASELREKGKKLKLIGVDPWEAATRMNKGSDISPDHILPILKAIIICKDWLRSGQIYTPDGNGVAFPGSNFNSKNLFQLCFDLFSFTISYDREQYKISGA